MLPVPDCFLLFGRRLTQGIEVISTVSNFNRSTDSLRNLFYAPKPFRQTKYQQELSVFIPLALETLGPINNTGIDLISDLARDLTRSTGDPTEFAFLFNGCPLASNASMP